MRTCQDGLVAAIRPRVIMDSLSLIGNWATILGLLVSLYTLWKVTSLSATLRRRSFAHQLADLLAKVRGIPAKKPEVAPSMAREIELLVKAIRLSEVSRWPVVHKRLRGYLDALESEVQGQRQKEVVKMQLLHIQNEIEIR